MKPGRIVFVGAGPSPQGLLTVRGREILERAEVLVYDEEIPATLLIEAPDGAERFLTTGDTAELLLSLAKKGRETVRLIQGAASFSNNLRKEAAALAEAGVPFEVIPGVSPEIAASVFASIPLPTGEWILRGGEGEVQILSLKGISPAEAAGRLIDAGWPSSAPAALVAWGARREPRVERYNLGWWTGERESPPPGSLLIVGEGMADSFGLSWFEKRPLSGKRVLVTRAKGQGSLLSKLIRDQGGEAVELPMIRLTPPPEGGLLDDALRRLSDFSWVVFTSANGVDFFFQRLRGLKRDIRKIHRAKIAAVGPKTAQSLEEKGIMVDLIPKEHRGEGLAAGLASLVKAGEEILLPRANIARKRLVEELVALGCRVTDAPAYHTLPDTRGAHEAARLLREGQLDILTFTSPSTVRNFVQAMKFMEPEWKSIVSRAKIACIGPVTADTAEKQGLSVDGTAEPYTIEGLAEVVSRLSNIH
ncbi:bifunctional uroporphyrinogen-III C-methyltransferase/uroporphyrinogen-III synthase [Salinithrix halophila]|uniref:Uroporphyrinogen-III synthase n=1 Tax=Salinithrix halophila TaxID=1485204 RepID=A0ABV8JIJ1_9BACL